jgi:hypothetical protein
VSPPIKNGGEKVKIKKFSSILFEFQASTTREMACLKAEEKYLQYILNESWRFLSPKYLVFNNSCQVNSSQEQYG